MKDERRRKIRTMKDLKGVKALPPLKQSNAST